MKRCDICGFETENGRVMSNHKRWKHSSACFSPEGFAKLKELKKPRVTRVVTCSKCGKPFSVTEKAGVVKEKYFCSTECAHSRVFSEASREKKRIALRKSLEERGMKLHPYETRLCEACGSEFATRYARTCSPACRKELVRRQRLSGRDLGDKVQYKAACAFRFALSDYPDEFDFELVKSHGWYRASNRGGDGTGVSRDHMLSVDYGWRNHIDPAIVSHPANCKLLLHSENFKKGTSCSISLEELQKRIKAWDSKYEGRVVITVARGLCKPEAGEQHPARP